MTTEAAYQELHDAVRGYVRNRVKDRTVVDDLVQDIFAKAHTSIDGLRNGDLLGPWLFRIAHNRVVDHYRKQKPTTELPKELADTYVDNEKADFQECVLSLVDALPSKYKDPLKMSDLEGKSQKELATHFGISYSGIRSRVQRAREMVRTRFESCCQQVICGTESRLETTEMALHCPSCDA